MSFEELFPDIKTPYEFYLNFPCRKIGDDSPPKKRFDNEETREQWRLLNLWAEYGRHNKNIAVNNLKSKDAFYRWLWYNDRYDTPESRQRYKEVVPILQQYTPTDLLTGLLWMTEYDLMLVLPKN